MSLGKVITTAITAATTLITAASTLITTAFTLSLTLVIAIISMAGFTHIQPLDEAHHDFYGFPTNPLSIFHTGPGWKLPTGPQAQPIPKEARPIYNHPIAPVWHQLGKEIYNYFDSIQLKWTSIDPVCFAEVGAEPGPLFLWVGVMPKTLLRKDAEAAATRCKEILAKHNFTDVEIAFRESVYTRFIKPQLLDYVSSVHPTASVRGPFTPALGLQIARKDFPNLEGTGGLYFHEGGRVFLLTTRHVALPLDEHPNDLYHHENSFAPRLDVIHLGSHAYTTAVNAIWKQVDHDKDMIKYYNDAIGKAADGEELQAFKSEMEKVEKSKTGNTELYGDINRSWAEESQRIIGYIFYSPPISEKNGFNEDWALIELDHEKFNWSTFRGNVIDLGSGSTAGEFMQVMHPHHESRAQFKYPSDGLMQLQGFVNNDELHHPTMKDEKGETCIIVVKNGRTTGLTFGRATGMESFVRTYENYGIRTTTMEIAIYSYDHKASDFATHGDSGSIVADGNNRIVGMITGGITGPTGSTDVTYASPYHFLDEQIKNIFPNIELYPI